MTETIERFVSEHGHLPGRAMLATLAGSSENAARRAIDAYAQAHPEIQRSESGRAGQRRHIGAQVAAAPMVTAEPQAYTYSESGDIATLETPKGQRIQTLEQLLKVAQVDQDVWSVKNHVVNSWEGLSRGEDNKITVTSLFQVKASLERSRPAADLKALKADALAAIEKHAPTYAPITRAPVRGGHILVLSPADAHIGKGAWALETGADMGIPEAVQAVRESVEALTADALPLGIAEIVLVIGNDFLQTDTEGHTTAGTPVSTAGTYRQAFAAGRDLAIELIERLTVHAHVTVLCVPGNHDRMSVLHMADVLAAWFRNAPDVTVDAAPTNRKYLKRGRVLLGFTHGNEEKHADLPQIMAQERSADWAGAVCREFITGHYHRKAARHYLPLVENGGVIVRTVSALSRSDSWHVSRGFLSTPAAEAFVYHPESGLKAQFHHRSRVL